MAVSLGELATRFGCELRGDPDVRIERVATLANAGSGCLTFLANPAYAAQLAETAAAAVVLAPEHADACPTAALIADDPYLAYAHIAALLHPAPTELAGVHDTATVADDAVLGDGCAIGPHAVIGARCRLGDRVSVGAGCVVGDGTVVGDDTRLLANSILLHDLVIGARCVIHPGAVIGADGFGNARSREGWVKVPQIGRVVIGDDVEIGANTTVDRGAIEDTVIGNGVRLDNLIQIAHNVRIGEHTAMASQVGIAGSSTIGKRCMLAGQSGLVGHISICDDVVVGGATMVTKNITEPGVYTASFPAEPDRDWKRKVARFRRLDILAERVGRLLKGQGNNDD